MEAISCIIISNNVTENILCVCCEDGNGKVNAYEITFSDSGYYNLGLWHAPIQISTNLCFTSVILRDLCEMIVDYAILIMNSTKYCFCITKDLLVRDEFGLYSIVTIQHSEFKV